MAHQVFISFSSKDIEIATKIRHGLETRHVICWMSTRDVPVGADFQEAIIDALEKAQVMVLVFSTNANNSNEMKKELVLAGEYNLPVLPVRIENVVPSGAFRFQLTTRQYLDLFEDWDANMAKLAAQITQFVESHVKSDQPADPLPEPVSPEESLWSEVKDRSNAAELNRYLERFPQGRYAERARQRIAMLQQAADPPERAGKEPSPQLRPRWRKAVPIVATALVGLWLAGSYAFREPSKELSGAAGSGQANSTPAEASVIPALSWVGFAFNFFTPDPAQANAGNRPRGAYVTEVEKESPAEKAGIAAGDVIVSANGKQLKTEQDFISLINDTKPGQHIELDLWRNGKALKQVLVLGDMGRDAASGNAGAMRRVGTVFITGTDGVPLNYGAAMEWLGRAADHGNQAAMVEIGLIHLNGWGVKKNVTQAMDWFRKAAELGEPQAMTIMGAAYENGLAVKQDYAMALEWYRKAAKRGNVKAISRIGNFYASGAAVAKDDVQALAWYRKAAEFGDADAMTNIGIQYENGQGVTQDYAQSLSWYRQAAKLGNAHAMTYIAGQYAYGLGVTQDDAQALDWYRKAADLGDGFAMASLGMHYANGTGVPRDYVQARSWLEQAADQGDPAGMNYLGVMYANGLGVAKDYDKALSWFRQAEKRGSSFAMTNVGDCYAYGNGVAQDYAEALRWYIKAAKSGDAEGARRAAMLYVDGKGAAAADMNEALRWMRFSASKQNPLAIQWLSSHGYD